jgi:hypothetical protein
VYGHCFFFAPSSWPHHPASPLTHPIITSNGIPHLATLPAPCLPLSRCPTNLEFFNSWILWSSIVTPLPRRRGVPLHHAGLTLDFNPPAFIMFYGLSLVKGRKHLRSRLWGPRLAVLLRRFTWAARDGIRHPLIPLRYCDDPGYCPSSLRWGLSLAGCPVQPPRVSTSSRCPSNPRLHLQKWRTKTHKDTGQLSSR